MKNLVISAPLFGVMRMFCKHKWYLMSDMVTKSKFEHAMEVSPDNVKSVKIPRQMCSASRKHIQVFTCEKCGKLKRFVEAI